MYITCNNRSLTVMRHLICRTLHEKANVIISSIYMKKTKFCYLYYKF